MLITYLESSQLSASNSISKITIVQELLVLRFNVVLCELFHIAPMDLDLLVGIVNLPTMIIVRFFR